MHAHLASRHLHLSLLLGAVLAEGGCLKTAIKGGSDHDATATAGAGGAGGGGATGTDPGGEEGGSSMCGEGGSASGTLTYAPPPGFDGTEIVGTLSAAQVDAWCAWYATSVWPAVYGTAHDAAPFGSDTTMGPWIKDGTIQGGAGAFTGDPENLCIEQISAHDCAKNLAATSCGATVQALSACAEAFVRDCADVVSRCAPYVAQCDGAIVTHATGPGAECALPIE